MCLFLFLRKLLDLKKCDRLDTHIKDCFLNLFLQFLAINEQFRDADVLVVQELFHKGCLPGEAGMSRLLRPYGYVYSYQPLDAEANFPKFVGAGLLIASKWPIVKKDSIVFKKIVKTTSDYLATKGALYVAIQKGQKVYHIFNTHLQATDSSKAKRVRLEQTNELKLFKDRLEIPQHEPVIFAGDFNEDYWTQTGECAWVFLLFKAPSS